MIAYTTAFLAAANLLALAHAAPAQPVCFAVTTVITGTPVWVPRADPTTSAGWGAWSSKDSSSSVSTTTKAGTTWSASASTGKTTWTTETSSGGAFYPVTSSSSIPLTTITVTPSSDVHTTSSPEPSTTTPAPAPAAPTCAATGTDVFSTSPSGSCDCDFTVSCNKHSSYTASTKFWERTSGEIIGSLQECQNICNDNKACEAAIWVNKDGAPSSEYMRCWQASGLSQPDSDGYGQISFKGTCSGSCSKDYSG